MDLTYFSPLKMFMFRYIICLNRCSVGLSGHLLRSTASWRSRQAWDARTLCAGSRTIARHWRTVKLWTGWKTKTLQSSRKWARNRTARALRKTRAFPWKSRLWQVSFRGEYRGGFGFKSSEVFNPLVWLYAFSVVVFNTTAVAAVEETGENAAAVTEHSKLSDQDKVQWLTDRLAHSVTDMSRTRPDQTGSGTADKGRWVKRRETDLLSYIYIFWCAQLVLVFFFCFFFLGISEELF